MGSTALRLTRLEKALVALATASCGLWLLQPTFPFLLPFRQFTLALALILAGLVAMHRLMGLAQWAVRKMLWRVRHRMIAVFFFVGVLPISLGALLVAWGVLLVLGPVTAFMVTSQMVSYSARMQAVAEPLLWRLAETPAAERPETVADYHEHAAKVFPGLVILAEFDGITESHPAGALLGAMPSKLLAEEALVRREDGTYLVAAAEGDLVEGRVIVAVPVTAQLMRDLMPGLGVLLVQFGESDDGPGRRSVTFTPALGEGTPLATGDIPPPRHPLDWQINWPIQTRVLDWDTDQLSYTTYVLRTRPSALWGRVFAQESEFTLQAFTILGYALLAAFGANLLVSLFIAGSMTRTLTRAVNDLYVGTTHVNRGDFSYRIPVKGSDQVSDLSRSFNAMTESIERLIEESQRRMQLEAELEIAREVQARLFPAQPPANSGLEILGICRPARSVSGDFYDYLSLDENRLAICFGDVSGKGISAALVMASLHSIMRTQLSLLQMEERSEPERAAAVVVGQANAQLCEGTAPEKFSTLFFAAFDDRSGTLAYCNAGHLPPLLLRKDEITPLAVNGMIVGAFPFAEYTADTVQLQRGDLLVAFTDGLTEPENAEGEEYGEERLRQALRRSTHAPPKELIESVMNEVVAWTGETTLQDDMTMLVVRKR